MEYKTLIIKKEEGVATITLNRPEKLNALSGVGLTELRLAALEVAQDKSVRVVVITGAGRAFSAGGDLDSDIFERRPPNQIVETVLGYWQVIPTLRNLDRPVIAAVNGPAVAYGAGVALGCDIIIASDKAKFNFGFVLVGTHPPLGISYNLPRQIGTKKTLELMFTGKTIDANEAEKIGLVNQVVPHDQFEATVREFAQSLAKQPPIAIGLIKKAVYQGMDIDLASVMEVSARNQVICLYSEDLQEAVKAWQEKRKPVFTGK